MIYVVKNIPHRFHSIEEERRAEFIEALIVLVRRPELVEGFFAPAEYSNKV
jgi:hypothetical protein